MQIVSDATRQLVDNHAKVTLTAYVDGKLLEYDIGLTSYYPNCGSDSEFSIGNATSAYIEFYIAAARPDLEGHALTVRWAVDEEDHPLFTGTVKTAKVSAGRTTITAWDAMTYGGRNKFTAAYTQDIDAATAFASVAVQMGIEADADAVALLSGITITGGLDVFTDDTTNSAVAGCIAALVGGNAVISREGKLAIARYAVVDWSSEPYEGGAQAENNDFSVTGLTFQREVSSIASNVDGTAGTTTETTEFSAGDGTLMFNNPLADQDAVDRAMETLADVVFRPGSYTIPGGILLEPGDIISVESMDGTYSVAVTTIFMSIDGGVKSTIGCGGESESSGVVGTINQALKALQADYAKLQKLVAENASIINAKINNLSVEDLKAGKITSLDGNAWFDLTTGRFGVHHDNGVGISLFQGAIDYSINGTTVMQMTTDSSGRAVILLKSADGKTTLFELSTDTDEEAATLSLRNADGTMSTYPIGWTMFGGVPVLAELGFGISVDLASEVSGILPVPDGGTGANNAANARANLGAVGKPVLIWENASPTSEFAEQTITANASGYSRFLTVFGVTNSLSRYVTAIFEKGKWEMATVSTLRNYYRSIKISSTAIAFSDSLYYATYGNATETTDNTKLIPVAVYGIE